MSTIVEHPVTRSMRRWARENPLTMCWLTGLSVLNMIVTVLTCH